MTRRSRYRPLDQDDVSPEEQQRLLSVPNAMEDRRVRLLGRAAVPERGKRLRGRRREEMRQSGTLDLTLPDTIPVSVIEALGKSLKGKQPIFDKFTKAFAIDEVTPEVLRDYIEAANFNNKRKPTDPSDRREARIIRQNKQRQVRTVGNNFQRSTFEYVNLARLNRASISAVRRQIDRGEDLDPAAAIWAGQAIYDIGNALSTDARGVLQDVHDEGLGMKIQNIGELVGVTQEGLPQNPDVLVQNPELLRLTQLEQAARYEFWRPRFELSVEVLGNRLTPGHVEDADAINEEVARLMAI